MRSLLAILAGVMLAFGNLVVAPPAMADFAVSPPSAPKAKRPKAKPKPRPTMTRASNVRRVPAAPQELPKPTGYNPSDLILSLRDVGLSPSLIANPDGTQTVQAPAGLAPGLGPWSVQLAECAAADRCRKITFSIIWDVENDANVCNSWKYYVTRDMDGSTGMPLCTAIPSSGRRMQAWLSSDQAPYTDIGQIDQSAAQARIGRMVHVWTTSVRRLPEAQDIAKQRCPKKKNRCW